MLRNFSYVIKDRLAGCAAPGSWDFLDEDLEALKDQGITALVSLTEEPLDERSVREAGLDYLHEPIPDFHAPSLGQIRRFVDFVRSHIERKKPGRVAVHCFAGRGRTGTMLANYLVATGVTADEAIRTLRRMRPGSIETREQERAIAAFQAWLQEMGQWKTGKKRKRGTRKRDASRAAKSAGRHASRANKAAEPATDPPEKPKLGDASGKDGKKAKPKGRGARGRKSTRGHGSPRGQKESKGRKTTPKTPDFFEDIT